MMNVTPTQEYVKTIFEYKDGALIWKKARPKIVVGTTAGSVPCRNNPYIAIKLDGKLYKAHRLIFLWHYGAMPEYLDHINGNKLDNRIESLRPATKRGNARNKSTPIHNTSGVKNVSWSKHHKKWRVFVATDNVRHKHIGYFEDLELAELVAYEAREKFHAAFARHV